MRCAAYTTQPLQIFEMRDRGIPKLAFDASLTREYDAKFGSRLLR